MSLWSTHAWTKKHDIVMNCLVFIWTWHSHVFYD